MKIANPRGFTLIELLVVIAIIGLLSSIVFASLDAARGKARDAKRISDIRQIERALELHYHKYGSYTQPEGRGGDCSTGSFRGSSNPNCNTNNDWHPNSDLRILVTDGFLPTLPIDPINNETYRYTYEPWDMDQPTPGTPAGKGYDLCATLEAGGMFCVQGKY